MDLFCKWMTSLRVHQILPCSHTRVRGINRTREKLHQIILFTNFIIISIQKFSEYTYTYKCTYTNPGFARPQEGVVGLAPEDREAGRGGRGHHGQCEGPAHRADSRGPGPGLAPAGPDAGETKPSVAAYLIRGRGEGRLSDKLAPRLSENNLP